MQNYRKEKIYFIKETTRKDKKMSSNEKEFSVGQTITVDCDKEQIIVDKSNSKVLIWLSPEMEIEIPMAELKYDVTPTYPQSIQEILNLFQIPVKGIVKKKSLRTYAFSTGIRKIWYYKVSVKEYLKKELEKIKVGETYFCAITSIAPWGLFVKIDEEFTALCHCTEVSKSKIYELDKCFKVNELIQVKVISKQTYADYYRIIVSRKQTATPNEYNLGDIVEAMITSQLNEDSYFCEINPAQKGIYHVDANTKLVVGQYVYGVLTKIESEGLRLRRFFVNYNE